MAHERHRARVERLAVEQLGHGGLGLLVGAANDKPVGAFGDEEAADSDEDGRHQGGRVHPAPGVEVGVAHQHGGADRDAGHGADRLEGEGAEHEAPAQGARDVFRDDHMRGWIVAAERHADAEQADRQRDEVLHHGQQRQEGAEHDHLGDEHALAAEIIRHSAEEHGANQDAGEACRGDEALFIRDEMVLPGDQRHSHAAHEHHESLEELAGGGEHPDAPLHAGQRRRFQSGAVRPGRQLVDILLDCLGAWRRPALVHHFVHGRSSPCCRHTSNAPIPVAAGAYHASIGDS